MTLLTGLTYYSGIGDLRYSNTTVQSEGVNSFNFPLNVQDYGEEPFIVGGKYGPHFVSSGDVSENLIDWRLTNVSFAGGFVATGNSLSVSFYCNKSTDLSCAALNNLVWKAAKEKWGANASTNFKKLTKFRWDGFEIQATLKPYYRGTEEQVDFSSLEVSFNQNGFTSVWYTNQTFTLGGNLYLKIPITIIGRETSLGLTTGTTSITTSGFTGTITLIPKLKPVIQRLVNPTDCRLQELWGVNSIYAILDRLTFKYKVTLNITSTSQSSKSYTKINNIDYKIINSNSASGTLDVPCVKRTGSMTETLCNNIRRTGTETIFSDSTNTTGCTLAVHLFDEDSLVMRSWDDGISDIYPIIPTCVFDFPTEENPKGTLKYEHYGLNLDRRTNGLISNIRIMNYHMTKNHTFYITKQNYEYLRSTSEGNNYFVLSYFSRTGTGFSSQYDLGNLPILKYGSTIKENIGVISDNFIVIDGIPRGCNQTHYLTGTMFVVEDINNGYPHLFSLYIGVRRLNKHIINKITHYNNYDFSYLLTRGELLTGSTSTHGLIMMTSDYTCWLDGYTAPSAFNSLSQYKTSCKYFEDSDMINSLTDTATGLLTVNESDRVWFASDITSNYVLYDYWGKGGYLVQEMFPYDVEAAQESIRDEVYESVKENFTNCYLKISDTTYWQTTHNIRVMIYPTFTDYNTTTVSNLKCVAVNNSDKKTVRCCPLTDSEYTYFSRWFNGINLNTTLSTLSNGRYADYYYDGLKVSMTDTLNTQIVVGIKEYHEPITTYNNCVDITDRNDDIFYLPMQNRDNYLPTFDTCIFRQVSEYATEMHPMCQIIYDSLGNPIGTIRVSSVMRLNMTTFKFYIDISARITLVPSVYRSTWTFPPEFIEAFSVEVGMTSVATKVHYPLLVGTPTNDYTQYPTYYVNNGILITNFKVYETNDCPFTNSTEQMKLKFSFILANNNALNLFTNTFILKDTCIDNSQSNKYQDCGFIYIPSHSDYDRVSKSSVAKYKTNATRTYGSYNNVGTGVKLNNTTNDTFHISFASTTQSRNCVAYVRRNVFTVILTSSTGSTFTITPAFYTSVSIGANVNTEYDLSDHGYSLMGSNLSVSVGSSYVNKPIMYRSVLSDNGSTLYWSVTTPNGTVTTGSTSASIAQFYNYSTSSIALGYNLTKPSGSNIYLKYFSIEGFDDVRANTVDF